MTRGGSVGRTHAWIVLAALGAMIVLNVAVLGADPWAFRTGPATPRGALGFLVSLADGEWDLGLLRSIAMLAGIVVAGLATAACLVRSFRAWVLTLACVVVVSALVLPAVALQAGLRDATAPWFHTNDSTYQIEIAGGIVRSGKNPYGYDYMGTGLERFYSLDGTAEPGVAARQVALHHLAYFPGTPLIGAAWSWLPAPFGDMRILVALATIGLLGAALLFPGPLWARLALGVVAAANPLIVRNAWFGTADALSLLLLMLSFAFAARRRPGWAGILVGAAILTKQFALVATPFLAVMLLAQPGRSARRAAIGAAAVVTAGVLPFLVADPRALWEDTVTYGTGTYRILGYGLSALLLRAGIVADRNADYPFFVLVLLLWAPVTAVLLRTAWRERRAWLAGAGFTTSIFLLLFIARVFHVSYLVYPMTGLVLTGLLALPELDPRAASTRGTVEQATDGPRPRTTQRPV